MRSLFAQMKSNTEMMADKGLGWVHTYMSMHVCMYMCTYILSIHGCNFFEELHKVGEVLEHYPGKHHVIH